MKKLQSFGSILFALLFSSSTLFCVTSAERKLYKVYRCLGFSRNDATVFCANFAWKVNKRFCPAQLKKSMPNAEWIAYFLKQGLLLPLSIKGQDFVRAAAKMFVNRYVHDKSKTKRAVQILSTWVKRFIYAWIVEQLAMYEPTSFQHVYTFTNDFDSENSVSDVDLAYGDGIFLYAVAIKKEAESVTKNNLSFVSPKNQRWSFGVLASLGGDDEDSDLDSDFETDPTDSDDVKCWSDREINYSTVQ